MKKSTFLKSTKHDFRFYYSFLGSKIFISFLLTLFVGVLDSFGIALIFPVFQLMDSSKDVLIPSDLGHLKFVGEVFVYFGLKISIISILFVVMFFFILKGAINYAVNYFNVSLRATFVKKIRIELLNSIKGYSYRSFTNLDVGELQNNLTIEVERTALSFINFLGYVQRIILVVIYLSVVLFLDYKFAISMIIIAVPLNFLFQNVFKSTKDASTELTDENQSFQKLLIQAVNNYKYLKSTNSIKLYFNKLITGAEIIEFKHKKLALRQVLVGSLREPLLIMVLISLMIVQIYVFGSKLSLILVGFMIFYRTLNTFLEYQSFMNQYLMTSGSLNRVVTFLKRSENAESFRSGDKQVSLSKQIEFKGVAYSYDSKKVIEDLSLRVSKDQIVALVGTSGSGKSTLVNLISGLLHDYKGQILVDDIDFKSIDHTNWQSKIGYITQEPVIFDDTVFNNITLWDESTEVNRQKCFEALRKATLLDLVNQMEDGLNTSLGFQGFQLSGGQRQRISIARELYKDVNILILDEATSALDTNTEIEIQNNIYSLRGNYTIIMIAHRLSTIKKCDVIYLMNKGRIEESGSFDELLESSETFRKMVNSQVV